MHCYHSSVMEAYMRIVFLNSNPQSKIAQGFTTRYHLLRVDVYSYRLEIISPVGVYGGVDLQLITQGDAPTRNRIILKAAQDFGLCEDRHTGIPRANAALLEAGLSSVELKVENGYFKAILHRRNALQGKETNLFS